MRRLWPASILSLAIGMSSPATAQDTPSSAREADETAIQAGTGDVVYPASFFVPFNPQTALDVLQRTPGFSLDIGGEARGFGANAGNVLIDGRRPTVKSGGIEAVLGRIAAARIERVEVLRNAGTAEAMGRAVIANIVLRAGSGGSGNASLELRHAPGDDAITPRLDVNYARPIGQWEASGSVLAWFENNPDKGEYRTFDTAGDLVSAYGETATEREDGGILTFGLTRAAAGGNLGFNGRLAYEKERYEQLLSPLEGFTDSSLVKGTTREWDGELGADWTHALGRGWNVKLVGLGRATSWRAGEAAETESDTEAFSQSGKESELVWRATAQRQGEYRLLPELGGEIAWNRASSTFADGSPDGPFRRQVGELRADLFANATLSIARPLRLEAGMGFEASRIAVDDEPTLTRTLSYWKPSAALVWDIGPATQLRIDARRTAGQLDFDAFAESGDLIDNRPLAGNADLRPEITTAFSALLDHRFGSRGAALSLKLSREIIDDALAYVPLDQGGQMQANFGAVRLWRVGGNATLPLAAFIPGARLEFAGEWASAKRPDPVTGLIRKDARDMRYFDITWRHDLEKLQSAYGFTLGLDSPEREWFIDEIQSDRPSAYLTAYAETMLPQQVKATLTVHGVTGERWHRVRSFFAPDLAGTPTFVEHRRRKRGAYVNLLLSRQF